MGKIFRSRSITAVLLIFDLFGIRFHIMIIWAGIITMYGVSPNYRKFWSTYFVSNLGRLYKNHAISNAYNFLRRLSFRNLTGNLIELTSKNKVTSLFFLNCIFFKELKDF